MLELGAALFGLLGMGLLEAILRERWFFLPALALATMLAIHATDVQPGLIRGIRDLGLTLLSWLLPVLAVIAAVFLAACWLWGLHRFGQPISRQNCC